ncbi:hypothetical protein CK203_037037 [Vitis vinifera]|uniref:Uncharacterized protein n=1 Tax=Vitis vinifera TaxID=29760 RepID=A0A438I5T2_VITVI|nr:hypothetical protein CK203_037037 [Vitis vinifera]
MGLHYGIDFRTGSEADLLEDQTSIASQDRHQFREIWTRRDHPHDSSTPPPPPPPPSGPTIQPYYIVPPPLPPPVADDTQAHTVRRDIDDHVVPSVPEWCRLVVVCFIGPLTTPDMD